MTGWAYWTLDVFLSSLKFIKGSSASSLKKWCMKFRLFGHTIQYCEAKVVCFINNESNEKSQLQDKFGVLVGFSKMVELPAHLQAIEARWPMNLHFGNHLILCRLWSCTKGQTVRINKTMGSGQNWQIVMPSWTSSVQQLTSTLVLQTVAI